MAAWAAASMRVSIYAGRIFFAQAAGTDGGSRMVATFLEDLRRQHTHSQVRTRVWVCLCVWYVVCVPRVCSAAGLHQQVRRSVEHKVLLRELLVGRLVAMLWLVAMLCGTHVRQPVNRPVCK